MCNDFWAACYPAVYVLCYYILIKCTFLLHSLEPQIQASMQELGQLLSKVKGAGQVSLSQPSQRSNIQQESDMVLRPLMDLLDGRWVWVIMMDRCHIVYSNKDIIPACIIAKL